MRCRLAALFLVVGGSLVACDPSGFWTDPPQQPRGGVDRHDIDPRDDPLAERVRDACAEDIELVPRGTDYFGARVAWDGARLIIAAAGVDGVSLLAVDADGVVIVEPTLVAPLDGAISLTVAALAIAGDATDANDADNDIALVVIDTSTGDGRLVRLASDFSARGTLTPMTRVIGDVALVPRADDWVLAFTHFPETTSAADPGDLVIATGAAPDPATGDVVVSAADPGRLNAGAVATNSGAAVLVPQRASLVLIDALVDDGAPHAVTLPLETYELTSVFAFTSPGFAVLLGAIGGGFRVAHMNADGSANGESAALLYFENDADISDLLVDGDDLIAVMSARSSIGAARITSNDTTLGLLALEVGEDGAFRTAGAAAIVDGAVLVAHPLGTSFLGEAPSGLGLVKLCAP